MDNFEFMIALHLKRKKMVSVFLQPSELRGLLDTDTKVHLLLMHHHPSQSADWNSPQAFRATMPELVSQYKEIFSGKV